ncbi:MAG: hypothetical protein JWN27_1256 [Candidatus Eremiobacteraeota bacterium]|nr:hypothetical protein [Candidatus Eremiobacteraeota bacterium]
MRGRQAKFRVYPDDHLPVHAHARIGRGEVIIEFRRDGSVALSSIHRDAVVGIVTNREIVRALEEAAEFSLAVRAEWKKMHR